MNEQTEVSEHLGYKIYYQGISYQCPALRLYGFAYEHNLKREIKRTVKKMETHMRMPDGRWIKRS